jgi:hypothetical protein
VRLLWSLPKAAPALLRHLAAYIDLAGLDLARAHKEIAAQLVATGIAAIVAGIYRSSLKKSQVLGSVRRAWQEDQVLLERILSSDED